MDGSEFVVSMIEVTTMFVRSSLGRDDVIENKKVYSQVTTDKEQKKLMKVLYPKKTKKLTT
jgi:hypothetical protein